MSTAHHAFRAPADARASSPNKAGRSWKPPRQAIKCPDIIALVAYHHQAMVLSTFVPAFDAHFAQAIDLLPKAVGGQGTNITAALRAANALLAPVPKGLRRRIWLLTDGQDNHEADLVLAEVARSATQRTNINTVGFGEGTEISPNRLRDISYGTKTGRYMPAESAQALNTLLRKSVDGRPPEAHQGEATVFCIDVSLSMNDKLGGRRKIDVVRDTMLSMIRYKQQMWS
jgi:Mg-chelatase subunit ChlD